MNPPYIDSRGPLHIVLDGFIVVGRYHTLKEAQAALEKYLNRNNESKDDTSAEQTN